MFLWRSNELQKVLRFKPVKKLKSQLWMKESIGAPTQKTRCVFLVAQSVLHFHRFPKTSTLTMDYTINRFCTKIMKIGQKWRKIGSVRRNNCCSTSFVSRIEGFHWSDVSRCDFPFFLICVFNGQVQQTQRQQYVFNTVKLWERHIWTVLTTLFVTMSKMF